LTKIALIGSLLFGFPLLSNGQEISSQASTSHNFPKIILSSDTNSFFNDTSLNDTSKQVLSELRIGGYVSAYYSTNNDDYLPNGFVQFPTLGACKNQFSLNMALISMAYKSKNIRSNIAIHYGDVAESTWPKTFNLIQEANGGFKLFNKCWLDVGFFRSHIGIESVQSRENIASSLSVLNYHDPYYFSGIKLSYLINSKLTLLACVFNGYNTLVDNNKNKAFDFTVIYNPTSNLSLTYNMLTCDESPDESPIKRQRVCNNVYSSFSFYKFTFGLDASFNLQQNSLRADSTKLGFQHGALLVAKYQVIKKLAFYARAETFSDPNQILSGALDIGERINGTTIGIDFIPQKTISLSAEWRLLEADNLIFKQGNKLTNQRQELNLCLDLWF
jgi:hypothetical protein